MADANKISKRKKQEKIEPLFDRFAVDQVRLSVLLLITGTDAAAGRLEAVQDEASIPLVPDFLIESLKIAFALYSLYRQVESK